MKISRDPNQAHISEGGSYVSNFNNWRISLDGQSVDPFDLIDADDQANTVTYMVRDDQGSITYNGNTPVLKVVKGAVILQGTKPGCTGCSKKTQAKRVGQRWWLL